MADEAVDVGVLPLSVLLGFDVDAPGDASIPVTADTGSAPDGLDELQLFTDVEASATLERLLEDAVHEPDVAELVDAFHLRGSPEERMEAYFEGGMPQALSELMTRFGVNRASAVCDVGCGTGWLAYSLDRLGYTDVSAMDTNVDATEHLRSTAGARIDVVTGLDAWREIRHRYDALVSVMTIHHWDHIPWVALEARRTMKPGAYWFAISEWFADTPAEFLDAMTSHAARSRYRYYEWAYPASAYVDLIQSVGLTLAAVVPLYYRRNVFMATRPETPPVIDQAELDRLVDERLTREHGTVDLFWAEVDARRRTPVGAKLFTRPQMLVFRRTAVSPD